MIMKDNTLVGYREPFAYGRESALAATRVALSPDISEMSGGGDVTRLRGGGDRAAEGSRYRCRGGGWVGGACNWAADHQEVGACADRFLRGRDARLVEQVRPRRAHPGS